MRRSSKRSGFLLLEVLVSIAIISLGLIYVVRSFSSSARAVETATNFIRSVSLIEAKIWDLEAKGAIEEGRAEGEFEDEEGYTWSLEAEGLKDTPINEVDLKVTWQGPHRRQRVSLWTYLWNDEE